jgi:tetratricopeptide (TPR) repeat protein
MITVRTWGIFLAALFFTGTSYAGELVQAEAVKYYNEGIKAQKSGDFDSAKTAYQKAMTLAEGTRKDISKAIYNNFGVMYVFMENWELAAQAFSQALNLDPDYMNANFNLGILYAKMGDAPKALAYWGKALNKTNCYLLEYEKPQ